MTTALSAATLVCLPIGWMLWRRRLAQVSDLDQKWRDYQEARLESLQDRLAAQSALKPPEPPGYPELPAVPLAGLLPPPHHVLQQSKEL